MKSRCFTGLERDGIGCSYRFLTELPAGDLEWDKPGMVQNPETRKQRGQAHLAQLKGLLS